MKSRNETRRSGVTARPFAAARSGRAESRVLGEQVYETLRQEILTLVLAPKTSLDEHTLVERFAISRTPVREALRRLALEGFVELRPHRSATVAAIELDDVGSYFEAVRIIQKAVMVLAAQRRGGECLERVREAERLLEEACRSHESDAIPELNRGFHAAVAAASQNDRLIVYYGQLLDQGMRLSYLPLRNYEAKDWDREIDNLIQDHQAIIAAFEAGDARAIADISDQHVSLFQEQVISALTRLKGSDQDASEVASEHLFPRKPSNE